MVAILHSLRSQIAVRRSFWLSRRRCGISTLGLLLFESFNPGRPHAHRSELAKDAIRATRAAIVETAFQ
jgi:hypothetical protein